MKKIGILGCGMIADTAHIPCIKQVPDLLIHAVYDTDHNRACQLQYKHGITHAFETEKEFFSSDIDAVVICTPAPVHYKNVLDAAKHNLPVLCEKPLGMSIKEIDEMIKIMEDKNLPFYAGFNYRFSHVSKTIKQLIENNAVGIPRHLRLIYIWNLHGKIRNDNLSPLWEGRMLEGGPLVDCGLHQIDLTRWWLNSEVFDVIPVGVWCDYFEYPDYMYMHMIMENGVHSMIEVGFSYNATAIDPLSRFSYEIIGTDGTILYERENHRFELRNSKETTDLSWTGEKNFLELYEEFSRALHTGNDTNMPTAKDGLIATHLAKRATDEAVRERDKMLDQIYQLNEEKIYKKYVAERKNTRDEYFP